MTETQFQRLLDGLTQVSLRLDKVDARLDQIDLRQDRTDETIRDSHAELRRHFDVVVEHMDHKIGLLAEALVSVQERCDRLAAEIVQTRVELRSEIQLAFTALDRRISAGA